MRVGFIGAGNLGGAIARLAGDFPGSPVELSQVFTIDEGKIVLLEIHS
jgi:predicted dinucleotide-binding enzyme